MTSRMTQSLAASAAALLIAGCANLAPTYERPVAPVPAAWAGTPPGTAAPAAVPWRNYFADQRLQKLLDLALANNRDLRIAALNIERARAQFRVQDAATLPSVSVDASGTAARAPAGLTPTGSAQTTHQYTATVGATAFELDFFGRVANLRNQALEQFLSTEEARNAAQISLVAEVANAWFQWSADLARVALAEETLRSRSNTVALTEKRLALGATTALVLRQQQVLVAAARNDVATYRGQVRLDRNALELLLGATVPAEMEPAALDPALGDTLPPLPERLSSELLLRRPDILSSELQLRAATANIGAARAAFYPRISLTAAAGSASTELSQLFRSGAGIWSFVPQITLPIFDGGANRANLQGANAERDISLARYEQSIQTGFREVADALALRETIAQRLDAQQALVQASAQALELARARYTRGMDSWLEVLDAERDDQAARQGLIELRRAQISNGVTLYKVLGGGLA
ncbi:MAG TPA: efflux transporter outer membrane subunit [Ramlibacter sp.]|jgi:multidrug efflux system outer membrane protein|uniref:efflux transporter outer membrane subunit n=1 Tax=Ramlibacter sp. TaxID=1917967 RepID=UPI002D4B57E3|nr:efflux transporter outer membrane subunit [Ramlibacter sp.]HZY19198.1 efflux transporter outer membrane subunit [Ramlibacter sp.]